MTKFICPGRAGPVFRHGNFYIIWPFRSSALLFPGAIRKPPLVKAQTAFKKRKINKIWRKMIFNMAVGILTPCNVARLWHWFRQVTAPCNVAYGSGIMTMSSPSGSTPQCDTWLWDDMLLNSPGCRTLQCDMWLWGHNIDSPGGTTCNVAGGCRMTCHWIHPNVRHIGFLHLVSILSISPQLTCPFCTSLQNFIQIGPHSAEKNT